jgi:hypothetical protein
VTRTDPPQFKREQSLVARLGRAEVSYHDISNTCSRSDFDLAVAERDWLALSHARTFLALTFNTRSLRRSCRISRSLWRRARFFLSCRMVLPTTL